MARAAKATIDLSAIAHNFALAKMLAPSAKAIAIVKADAYGHGAVQVAKELAATADAFGVACIEEALELRAAGIENPILLLEGFFSADELPVIADNNFWTALHSPYQVAQVAQAKLSQAINVWPKLDTGMHRLGFDAQSLRIAYQQLSAMGNVADIVLMSHMACADEIDNDMSARQIENFDQCVGNIDQEQSLANSASILTNPNSYRQWLRVGLMMYGASPFAHPQEHADRLKPAMCFSTHVIAIRDVDAGGVVGYGASYQCATARAIATIAIGYADGYDRHIASGTSVRVDGQIALIAGRISMDMVSVDISGLKGIEIGSKVELWGKSVSVNDVAKAADTIAYTLFTGVTKRVPRVYVNSGVAVQ